MSLMLSTLTKLKELQGGKDPSTVRIPVYDKSLRGGRGDRSEQSRWTNITGNNYLTHFPVSISHILLAF